MSVSYSRALRGFTVGRRSHSPGATCSARVSVALAGFVRFGDEWDDGGATAIGADDVTRPRGAELFVDAGVSRV